MQFSRTQNKYCPLCGKIANARMGNLSDYWFCKNCFLGWIKIIPKTSYEDEYYISGSSLLSKIFSPIGYIFLKMRDYYTGFFKKKLWIDVGAGEGNYLEKVNAKLKIGVEISKSGRNAMKRKGLSFLTNEEFLKTKNLNADVVSFWHVLEHVINPNEYVSAAEKNLSESGKIIIAVPNINSFEFNTFGNFWFHLAPKYHVWFFSPKSLKKLLANSNLKIEKIDYWAVEHHLTGILQSFINRATNSDNILHKLIRRKQNLSGIKISQTFWIIFWCSLGLPVVILFWIVASLLKKPGAVVLVASKIKA